jgi:hypothetical protein
MSTDEPASSRETFKGVRCTILREPTNRRWLAAAWPCSFGMRRERGGHNAGLEVAR